MAKKLPERIETYAEYEAYLKRLREGAAMISDPLIDEEKKAGLMILYNQIDKLLGDYSERMRGKWEL